MRLHRQRPLGRIARFFSTVGFCLLALAARANDPFFITQTNGSLSATQTVVEAFTVTTNTQFTLRFASDNKALAQIALASALSTVTNGGSFTSFGGLSGVSGHTPLFQLNPGNYLVVVRDLSGNTNNYTLKLEYQQVFENDTKYDYTLVAYPVNKALNVAQNSYFVQPFTISPGYRYYLDGCSSGLQVYVIPNGQIANFEKLQAFTYYPDFMGDPGEGPGSFELTLAPGNYAIATYNSATNSKAIDLTLEQWQITLANNPTSGASGSGVGASVGSGGLALIGPASWSIAGSTISIQAAQIQDNRSAFFNTGTLSVEAWAVTAPFNGVSGSGYRMGQYVLPVTLTGGTAYTNLNQTVAYTAPAAGTYYTVILVTEYNGLTYPVQTYLNMSGTTTFNANGQIVVAPTILEQPADQNVPVGGSASFSVSTTGTPPLTYHWYHNGTLVPGATTATLSLANVTLALGGNYNVTISNLAGGVISSVAQLNAYVFPPYITVQPKSVSVVEGLAATLRVTAAGSPPLGYQWWKDAALVPGATNATLTFAHAQPTNAGAYSVVVNNSAGTSISSPAALTVLIVPHIVSQPTNQTVVAGSPASFSVAATGTLPMTYQWRKAGVNLAGATNATLHLANVQPVNAGAYTVLIKNAGGQAISSIAPLVVLVPPTFVAQPKSVSVVESNSTRFIVTAAGTAPLRYQWLKDGLAISAATNAILSFVHAQTSDAAAYSVIVSNAAGVITSSNAGLTVLIVPKIVTTPTNQTVIAGDTATFSVSATGTAPLSYQWRKNGANIAGATNVSLTLNNIQPINAGAYSVLVKNAGGQAISVNASLVVLVPPSIKVQPKNLTVIAGNPATFTVTATGTVPLRYQWSAGGVPILRATNATYLIPHAAAGDAATYSVLVTNAAGSATSTNVVLTVLVKPAIQVQPQSQAVSVGAPVNFSVTASGTAPLHYQWRKNGVGLTGATNATYSILSAATSFAGAYTVMISNTAGSVLSSNAVLKVN